MTLYALANFTTPQGWIIYSSTVTGGWFWSLILLAIWMVAFGIFSSVITMERAFATTSFFTGILAAFLYVMGGLDMIPTTIAIALAIAGFIMLLFVKPQSYG